MRALLYTGKKFFIPLIMGMALSACGGSDHGSTSSDGDGGSGSSTEYVISPSLGTLTNASVRLFQSDGSTELGKGDTGTTGTVTIAYDGDYSGPIIVAVIGDEDAQYYDEAIGSTVDFPEGSLLRALVPSGTTEVGVTILTEVAYQLALVNSIDLSEDTTINQLNERVRQALAPELSSILTPPTLFDNSIGTGSLDDNEADQYAARLAALAQLGGTGATPALSVAQQLAWDFSDGAVDGKHDGSPITNLVYTPANLVSDLNTALNDIARNFGTEMLAAALTGYGTPSLSADISDLLQPSDDDTTLPGGIAGQTVTMVFCCAASGAPFNDEDQVDFSFAADGSLTLTDKGRDTVIASNFTLRGSEYIWVDSNATPEIEYALSLNNGDIHEINLYGVGGTPFYGQFAPISGGDSNSSTDLTPDGDGAALSGANGATGTVAGTSYTYSGHPVAMSELYAYNPVNITGLFDAYDGSSAITRWSINGFPAATGSYDCGTNGDLPGISLTLNGVPYMADNCVIEIISASTTEVEGRFAAHLIDSHGTELGTVTDGYFRYREPTGQGGNTSSNTPPAALTELAGSYSVADTAIPEIFGQIAAGHMTLDLTIDNSGAIHYLVKDKDDDAVLYDETITWDGENDEASSDGNVIRLDITDEYTESVSIHKTASWFEFHLRVPLFIPGVGNGTRDAQWNVPYLAE